MRMYVKIILPIWCRICIHFLFPPSKKKKKNEGGAVKRLVVRDVDRRRRKKHNAKKKKRTKKKRFPYSGVQNIKSKKWERIGGGLIDVLMQLHYYQ